MDAAAETSAPQVDDLKPKIQISFKPDASRLLVTSRTTSFSQNVSLLGVPTSYSDFEKPVTQIK